MTPDERNMITGLFDRMRAQGAIPKEYEAEQLINQQVRQIPDSAYMLVQSVLVGEQTLNATAERIQQLEARIRELEAKGAQSSGGSFLGGLFGGGSSRASTSVPVSRSATPANSPWGNAGSNAGYQGGGQPQYGQPPMQQGGYAQPPPARAGGGFMAQAMTTAAGVAGGMLAANAISNMMGGHKSHSQDTPTDYSAQDAQQDAQQDQQFARDEQQDAQEDQQYAADDSNDPGDSGGGDSTDA